MTITTYDLGINLTMIVLYSIYIFSIISYIGATFISFVNFKCPKCIKDVVNYVWYDISNKQFSTLFAITMAIGISIIPIALAWIITLPIMFLASIKYLMKVKKCEKLSEKCES